VQGEQRLRHHGTVQRQLLPVGGRGLQPLRVWRGVPDRNTGQFE
jgi:hypothetical protein